MMTDTQIVDWIEENLTRLHLNVQDKLEMLYLDSKGVQNVVVADSLRECVELAVKEQDNERI